MNLMRQKRMQRSNVIHRQNIRKSLDRRLEAARSHNNQELVLQLEAEANYLGI